MDDLQLKISVLQLDLKERDIDENMNKINRITSSLVGKDPDIICIPELALEGYDFEYIKNFDDEKYLKIKNFYSNLAIELNSYVVAGMVENDGDNYYDTAVCFNSRGNIISTYRKLHLWGSEREFFKPGKIKNIIELKGWKIGIGICADIGFPEFCRDLVLEGAELLLFISAWVKPDVELWRLMSRSRAAENQVFLVASNRVGKGDGVSYCGNSLAVNPRGELVENLEEYEGYFIVNLNKKDIESRRNELPWLEMRRPNCYDSSNRSG